MSPDELLTVAQFPGIAAAGFEHTSPKDELYNCIAWAAGDNTKWWWPNGAWWPDSAPRERTIDAFVAAFSTLGYDACADGALEQGIEKIAIFAKGGVPTHASRQLPDGKWTTKAGKWVDLTHNALNGVDCATYGTAVAFMGRRIS